MRLQETLLSKDSGLEIIVISHPPLEWKSNSNTKAFLGDEILPETMAEKKKVNFSWTVSRSISSLENKVKLYFGLPGDYS